MSFEGPVEKKGDALLGLSFDIMFREAGMGKWSKLLHLFLGTSGGPCAKKGDAVIASFGKAASNDICLKKTT